MDMGESIQIDDGEFTRLHNTILEKLALARFTASEYRCLMFLFRATYGWQKKEDVISLSQWAAGVGIDPEKKRHNVLRTLQSLVAKRVVCTKSHGNNHAATWGFNKHFAEWDASLFQETVISPDNKTVMPQDNSLDATVITQDNTSVISPDNKTVISPDNHKRKKEILKKKDSSARARTGDVHPNTQPIMTAYIEALGYEPSSYGQEAKAAKELAKKGYEPADISAAYALKKSDPFWETKHLSLQTLAREIPAMRQALLKGIPLDKPRRAESSNNGVVAVKEYIQKRGLFDGRN